MNISTIDKFNYLKSLLEGPATRCVQGLPITERNYDSAVKLLQERFGKSQQIVVAHVDKLNKLPVARFIFDRVNVHIKGLKVCWNRFWWIRYNVEANDIV